MTKRARAARATRVKAIAMRVAGDKEDNGEGDKGNGYGNEVAGNKEGNCKRHL